MPSSSDNSDLAATIANSYKIPLAEAQAITAAYPNIGTLSKTGVKAGDPTNPYGLSPYDQQISAGVSQYVNKTLPAPPSPWDNVVSQQVQMAQDFTKNIPQLADTLYGQAENNQKTILASQLEDVTQNYNSRGLLYGAAKEGAKSAAQQQSAASLAQQKSDINNNLESTATNLNDQALNSAANADAFKTSVANANTDAQSSYLNIALNNQQQQSNALSSIGSALGTAGGYVAGTLTGGKSAAAPSTSSSGAYGLIPSSSYNNWPGSTGAGSGLGTAVANR